jgi:predicted Fe-Mo cluster-binding NifX family protein
MKAAFPTWNGRLAPVFDTAREITIVDVESGQVVARTEETLPDGLPAQKVMRLADLGVGSLVCGAISWPLREMATSVGIVVIPFVAGELNWAIEAWLAGTVTSGHLAMPGCGGQGRRWGGSGRRWRGSRG